MYVSFHALDNFRLQDPSTNKALDLWHQIS
jgi:hypothetical protein